MMEMTTACSARSTLPGSHKMAGPLALKAPTVRNVRIPTFRAAPTNALWLASAPHAEVMDKFSTLIQTNVKGVRTTLPGYHRMAGPLASTLHTVHHALMPTFRAAPTNAQRLVSAPRAARTDKFSTLQPTNARRVQARLYGGQQMDGLPASMMHSASPGRSAGQTKRQAEGSASRAGVLDKSPRRTSQRARHAQMRPRSVGRLADTTLASTTPSASLQLAWRHAGSTRKQPLGSALVAVVADKSPLPTSRPVRRVHLVQALMRQPRCPRAGTTLALRRLNVFPAAILISRVP